MIISRARQVRVILILVLLSLEWSPASFAEKNYRVRFLPLGFYMSCSSSTPQKNRVYYPRAAGALPGVSKLECADNRKQVINLKPSNIKVEYDEKFDKFEVVFILKDADVHSLEQVTGSIGGKGASQRLLISSDEKIVSAGYLSSPFRGKDFHVSTDSHQSAHSFSRLFVGKVVNVP